MTKTKGGIMPAAMTIWNSDESFNVRGMERYLRWLIDNGANNISICGSTGENITMTMDEQKQIIEVCSKYIAGEVPLYCGTGRYCTSQTIELTQFAADCGADGALIILPIYLKPHMRAVFEHYRAIRKAVKPEFDLMAYNNPWFAGQEFNARQVKTLYEEGILGSIKSAHGDPNHIHDLKNTVGGDLIIMYGHDYDPMEAFFAGADGWLSGLPAIFPNYSRKLFEACAVEKNVDKGRELWAKMRPFIDYFYTYTTGDPHWQEIFKYVLKLQGLDYAGLPRLPLGDLLPEEKKKVEAIMVEIADVI